MESQAASQDQFLPPELLSRIFRLTLPDDFESRPASIHLSPLLLGRVSKRWRDVSHATAELWISICARANESTSFPLLASELRAWLRRAGPRPLSLSLSVHRISEGMFPGLALLTKAALGFSSQIQYLQLHLVAQPHHYPVVLGTQHYLVLGDGGFPLLHTLDIDCPFDPADMVLGRMLTSATALRDLTLMNYPSTVLTLPAPLTQLRRLVCGPNEPPTTGREILRRLPELEECTLSFAPAPTPFITETILHRRLRSLHIGPQGFGLFLSWVTLPNLTHLTLDGLATNGDGGLWHQPSMTAFLARSRCALERLSFLKINMSAQDLVACLEMVSPTLTSLCVEGGPYGLVDRALLARLTAQASDDVAVNQVPILCPKLDYLRIHGGILEREGYGSGMVDMLESRFYASTPGVAHLKFAYIGGTFGPPQRKRVDKLKQDGLNLTFVLEGNRFL